MGLATISLPIQETTLASHVLKVVNSAIPHHIAMGASMDFTSSIPTTVVSDALPLAHSAHLQFRVYHANRNITSMVLLAKVVNNLFPTASLVMIRYLIVVCYAYHVE